MKNLFLLFLTTLYLQIGFSQHSVATGTSPLEKIYQQHLKAMGGEDKLNALKSYSYNSANWNNQISVISFKSPGLFNSSYTSDEGVSSEFIKGTESRHCNINGSVTEGAGSPSYVTMDIIQFSLHGFLFDAKRLNWDLTLLSPDETAQKIGYLNFLHANLNPEAIIIKVIPSGADDRKPIYSVVLDPETYLIQHISKDQYDYTWQIAFSDYETIDGLQVFSKTASGGEGKLDNTRTLSDFQLNRTVKPELFIFPSLTTETK